MKPERDSNDKSNDMDLDAIQILDMKYAKDEITKEEYEQMKKDLQG